jgi:hypothetical protein
MTTAPTSPSPKSIQSTLQQIRGDLFDMDSSNETLVQILDKVTLLTQAENEVVERQKAEIERLNSLLLESKKCDATDTARKFSESRDDDEYDVLSSGSFSTTTTQDAFERELNNKAEVESITEEISKLQRSKLDILDEIDTLRHQVSILVEERTSLIQDIQVYQHVKEVSDELDEVNSKLSVMEGTILDLNKELMMVKMDKDEKDRMIANQAIRLMDLEKELEMYQSCSNVDDGEATSTSCEEGNATIAEAISNEDSNNIDVLKREIKAIKAENESLRRGYVRERLGSTGNSSGDGTASVGHECDNVSVLFGQDSIGAATTGGNSKREDNRSIASADDASDHKSIRVHAEKLLYWANKAAERSKSPSPSVASGSHYAAAAGNNKQAISCARHSVPDTIGLPPRGSSSKKNRALPPRPPSDTASIGNATNKSDKENGGTSFNVVKRSNNNSEKAVIFNLDKVTSTKSCCRCSTSPFSGNDAHSEFYLPKLGLACSCGGGSSSNKDRASFSENPTALTNILRSWQCDFLASMSIHTADQLLKCHKRNANDMSRRMKQWRDENALPSARSKECYVALMVWARTAKVVLRSIERQKEAGEEFIEKPGFLDIACGSDAYTVGSVSTLGQMSSVGGRVHEMMEI